MSPEDAPVNSNINRDGTHARARIELISSCMWQNGVGRRGIGLAVAAYGRNDSRQLLWITPEKCRAHREEIAVAAHASLQGASAILRNLSKSLPDLEALYKD